MKRLVYGILRDPTRATLAWRCGLEGSPVALLSEDGLAAAFSVVPDTCATPSIAQVQAYARVVEALHQRSTILPMRYGCLLETEAQIRELLRVRRTDSLAALDELDGCVEMGLRVLPEGSTTDYTDKRVRESINPLTLSSVSSVLSVVKSSSSLGTGYLAERRARYAAKDSRHQQAAGAGERFRRIFAGLFVKCEAEPLSTAAGTLLSLHFLVRREQEECFRAAFRRLQEDSLQKVLLTGPWPPYHFAAGSKANGLP